MKNAIRCCISCILPCGALDVIRIVHSTGRVEEITATSIKASDVMKAYPKHILKKPSHHHDHHAIVVVPPDALLQRGKIYFLIPVPSPSKKKTQQKVSSYSSKRENNSRESNKSISVRANLVFSGDQYLSEILSEKVVVSTQKERRRGRVAVWRPHLESISETLSEAASTTTTSTDQ